MKNKKRIGWFIAIGILILLAVIPEVLEYILIGSEEKGLYFHDYEKHSTLSVYSEVLGESLDGLDFHGPITDPTLILDDVISHVNEREGTAYTQEDVHWFFNKAVQTLTFHFGNKDLLYVLDPETGKALLYLKGEYLL